MQLGVEEEEPTGRGMLIVQGDEIRRVVGELEVLGFLIIPTRGDDGMQRENDGSCSRSRRAMRQMGRIGRTHGEADG